MNHSCGGFCYPVFHHCGHFARNCALPCVPSVMCTFAPRNRRTSTLQLAKRKQRDSIRMTAFMNKKDAQNLPFYELETEELQELSFNSLLRMKAKCHSNCKNSLDKLETTVNSQAACISFLRQENADLRITAEVQNKKSLELSRENDRITEKYKKLLESQKRKTDELENSFKKKIEIAEARATLQENRKTQSEMNKLHFANAQLEQRVKALTMELEQQSVADLPKLNRKIINSAKEEVKFLSTEFVILCGHDEHEDETFSCPKCGSREPHPKNCCPAAADSYPGKCGCCKKLGHFTLLCKKLGQYL